MKSMDFILSMPVMNGISWPEESCRKQNGMTVIFSWKTVWNAAALGRTGKRGPGTTGRDDRTVSLSFATGNLAYPVIARYMEKIRKSFQISGSGAMRSE